MHVRIYVNDICSVKEAHCSFWMSKTHSRKSEQETGEPRARSPRGCGSLHVESSPNVFSWYLIFTDATNIYHSMACFVLQIKWRLRISDVVPSSYLLSTGYVLLQHTSWLEPRFLTRINYYVTPAGISNYTHWKLWYEITYPFPNFNGCTFEISDWISFSSHMLLGMWLLIQAGITVDPC